MTPSPDNDELAPDDEPDDEELAPEDDHVWDEITSSTFRLLGELRAERRRQRVRQSAYAVYIAVLICLIYVAPSLTAALRAPRPSTTGPAQAGLALPAAAVTLVLLVLVAFVRDALWRGPALLDLATSAWLLPAPVRRGPMLRPRLRATLLATGVLGAIVGAAAGALLRPHTGGSTSDLVAAASATGAVAAVLAVAAAGLVEAADDRVHRVLHGAGAWLWLAPTVSAGVAVLSVWHPGSAAAAAARSAGAVLLWSGPWGWAVQPLAAAVPGAAVGGVGLAWPAGLLAAAAVAVLATLRAYGRIDTVPARVLRARAASANAVAASIGTLQPRRARLLIQAAQGWTPMVRWRLPVPRHRPLLLPWRDATALLRMPSRLVWGLLWLAAAAALITAGSTSTGSASTGSTPAGSTSGAGVLAEVLARLGLTVPALAAGYLAAAQLVEAARLDADDPRPVTGLPIDSRRLAIWHAVVPLLVLGSGLGVAAVITAAVGAGGSGLLELALAAPALVAAALVSAYRGDLPLGLLVGAGTPMGDTGPGQAVLWYLRGPLAAVALLLPLASGRAVVPDAVASAVIMFSWARSRAHHVLDTAG